LVHEVDLEELSEPILFNKTIQLQDVSYAYPMAEKSALNNINMTIQCKQTIGFVGSTGSGKTTLADIILGILSPKNGSLLIDGQIITEKNRREWQKLIGYVPQNIYLADASVAENIAFGVEPSKIDHDQVKKAARVANLDNFIEKEMPHGYKSEVGERGVRLSGGQRQRIGIARAMYHQPDILILDEATSALDNITEHEVMDAVNALGQEITIILIAHRLSTVQSCDNLFFLQDGRIEDHGTFDELIKKNQKFKSMTQSKT
jgi:ABC-type multidrug transport system fused ATPase/permease subunit